MSSRRQRSSQQPDGAGPQLIIHADGLRGRSGAQGIPGPPGEPVVTLDGCRIRNSANQTISSATLTQLTYDTERWDNGGMHDAAVNPGRLTAQKTGYYELAAMAEFEPNGVGARVLVMRLNGGNGIVFANLAGHPTNNTALQISTVYFLTAGDYVDCAVYQDSGGNLNSVVDQNNAPEFSAQLIRPA